MDLKKYGNEYPVKAFEYGHTYEIRDGKSRTIVRMQLHAADIISKRKYSEILKFIAKAINTEAGIETIEVSVPTSPVVKTDKMILDEFLISNSGPKIIDPDRKRRGRPPRNVEPK